MIATRHTRHTPGDPGMSAATLARGMLAYAAAMSNPRFAAMAERPCNGLYTIGRAVPDAHVKARGHARFADFLAALCMRVAA